MTLFFHSDEVDEHLSLKEAVGVAEGALKELGRGRGIGSLAMVSPFANIPSLARLSAQMPGDHH